MWVADSGPDGKIYAYDMTTRERVPGKDFETLEAAGNDDPEGIWSDGVTMWVADSEDDKVFAYKMPDSVAPIEPPTPVVDTDAFDRKPSKDFDGLEAAGNARPDGIWSDGVTMWVADRGDRKIYAYDMTTRERVPGKDFDTLYAASTTVPEGIWSDGVTMWVADLEDAKIHAYHTDSKAWHASQGLRYGQKAAGNE